MYKVIMIQQFLPLVIDITAFSTLLMFVSFELYFQIFYWNII